MRQTVNGSQTNYALDLNNSLAQVLSDGSNTYLYRLDRIAQQNIVGWQYYLGDALGSARQLTNAVGSVTLARSYEPFGRLLSAAGNPLTKYGYTGEWTDPTNLIYLRARYYDPATGRFLSKDPVRGLASLPQTLNPYTYAANNPIRYTDPSGEIIPLLLFAAVGLAGGVLGGLGYYGLETWLDGNPCSQWSWSEAALWGITGGILGIPLGIGAGWLGSLAGWWGLATSGTTATAFQQESQGILSIPASSIRFTQNNISPYTRAGVYLDDLAQEIENGFFRGYLRLVQYEGKLYSLDNRRLATFKLLDKNVPAIIEDLNNPAIQAEFLRKFNTINDGLSILVRGTDLIIK